MPRVLGTSGRYEMDPVSNPTGAMRSGVMRSTARKSFGGPAMEGMGGPGKIGSCGEEKLKVDHYIHPRGNLVNWF